MIKNLLYPNLKKHNKAPKISNQLIPNTISSDNSCNLVVLRTKSNWALANNSMWVNVWLTIFIVVLASASPFTPVKRMYPLNNEVVMKERSQLIIQNNPIINKIL